MTSGAPDENAVTFVSAEQFNLANLRRKAGCGEACSLLITGDTNSEIKVMHNGMLKRFGHTPPNVTNAVIAWLAREKH